MAGDDGMADESKAGTKDVDPIFGERQAPPTEEAFADAKPVEIDDIDLKADDVPLQQTALQATTDIPPSVVEALRYAEAELRQGVCEEPGNRGAPHSRYVQWFNAGLGPSPWCAFFVSWCWDNATDQNRQTPWANPGLVESVRGWARSEGKLVETPRQGDLFGVGGNHIGWVLHIEGTSIVTIEGNTSSGCVASNRRPLRGLWFARIE